MNRLLALDGGGIRGIFSVAVLEHIESLLRKRFAAEKPGFVLADYFSFIGGNSTGAIIAAMLAKGMSVRAVRESYEQLGPIVFRRKPFWQSWRSFYGTEAFTQLLKENFDESPGTPMTLGSKKLKTWLMLVMRNGTTGSTWPITNYPEARYNRRNPDDGMPTNLDIPLWQLIRASAAAPAFFPTELVKLHSLDGQEQSFEFIDGAVSPYNNPAVAMYLAATLPAYEMNMPTGVDNLSICSIGTGRLPIRYAPGELGHVNVLGGGLRALKGLMDSVCVEQDKICRVLGKTVCGASIDGELDQLTEGGLEQFLYCRYQHNFTDEEREQCRRETGSSSPFELDDLASIPKLLEIGRRYAKETVKEEHFP
jgi:hypothetical protein